MNAFLVAIYNLIFESGIPIKKWQRELARFKNIHAGKPCVIVGNGPSVSLGDLERINKMDCVKIVFNRFHKVYEQLPSFNPDITMSIDPRFIEDFYDEIIDCHKGKLFIGHHRMLGREKEYNWFKVKTPSKFVFSTDPVKFISPGGSVVIASLQMALYMGCRDFYLYGIDHSFTNYDVNDGLARGDGNHFINDYRGGKSWYPPETMLIEEAFAESRREIEAQGGTIFNISRRTKLKELQTLEFEKFATLLSSKG